MIKKCIISEISKKTRIPANPNANPPVQEVAAIGTTGATFQINNAKLYVPVVILSINIKFLENIKQGFKQQFLGTNIDLKWQYKQKWITLIIFLIQNLEILI